MSGIEVKGQVGLQALSDGASATIRQGRGAEIIGSDYMPRFYEANRLGLIFSDGIGLTSISNATYTSATLGATCTPIAGVWNPTGSGKDLVLLRLIIGVTMTAATATGAAPFVMATSVGNAVITTGSAPFNRKTGLAVGSVAKGMSNVALTGLTNSLVVRGAVGAVGGSAHGYSHVGTAAGAAAQNIGHVHEIDGAIIIPPGGVFAALATTTPVAHSAASALLWIEVPS